MEIDFTHSLGMLLARDLCSSCLEEGLVKNTGAS